MRVSAITSFSTNISQPKKNDRHGSFIYGVNEIKSNNSPSFGVLIIDNIYNWGIRKINQGYSNRAQQQINKIRHAVLDDVDLLASRKGVSKESVQKEYGTAISKGGIIPKYDDKEVGLNKVVGYSLEKLETIKKAVVPVLETAEAKKTNTLTEKISAPSGIIIHGRAGGGKHYFAQSLLEHIDYKANRLSLPIKTITVNQEWWKGDTKENIETLQKAFKEARKNNKKGEQTILYIDNMNEIFTAENNEKLVQEFTKQTQHPKKDGLTWIGTIENTDNLTKSFFKPSRTSLFIEIDKPKSESEAQALLYHFVSKTGRESQFDERYIMDYTRNSDIPFTPDKIKQIVKFADDELRMAKDYSSKRKGNFKAPILDMQMMMGVDFVARYNKDKVLPPIKREAVNIPMETRLNLKNSVYENKKVVNC